MPAAEQPRADRFEISPTGPLIGFRVSMPQAEPLRIEQAAFAAHGLTPQDFKRAGSLRVKGDRRPLRVQPTDIDLAAGVDEHGPHITVAFTLPAGSFATVLMRELMKESNSTSGRSARPRIAFWLEPAGRLVKPGLSPTRRALNSSANSKRR